jgi:hypothetical protein
VVAANTGEASRTADNAIIVFFIISSFNVIGYERDSAWHRRSGVALGKNCNVILALYREAYLVTQRN